MPCRGARRLEARCYLGCAGMGCAGLPGAGSSPSWTSSEPLRSLPPAVARLPAKTTRCLTEPHLPTASGSATNNQIYLVIQGFYRSSLRSGDGWSDQFGKVCGVGVRAGSPTVGQRCGPQAKPGSPPERHSLTKAEYLGRSVAAMPITAPAKWPSSGSNVTWQRAVRTPHSIAYQG